MSPAILATRSTVSSGPDQLCWKIGTLGTPTLNEACVRGHIPLKLNNSVGGAYGGLITSNRLIDADPFWVSVTP